MKLDFQSFKIGALLATMIIVLILVLFWQFQALPFLHGITYNMQLDELALRALGISPTSSHYGMWYQVGGVLSRLNDCPRLVVCN